MSKSRRSKTLAAGAMIGLTPYAKQFSLHGKTPAVAQNRQTRRAQKRG